MPSARRRPAYRKSRYSRRDDDYSSGSEYTDSSEFTRSDSESDESSWETASGSDSRSDRSGDSETRSGSSYTTPSSDSGDSRSTITDESYDVRARARKRSGNTKGDKKTSRLAMAASLALQRRKRESPQLRAEIEKKKVREVDYSKNPTKLYRFIEKTMWREAAERCRTAPIDAKIWVYRRSAKNGGGLMWRMLPIHAAILYRAPVYVLLDLLDANPTGPSEPDDRNMLPIHMACRILCKEDVIRLLLKHHPTSFRVEDIKGRTPMKILEEQKKNKSQSRADQKSSAKNRKQLITLLEEHELQLMEKGDLNEDDAPQNRLSISASTMSGPKVRMREKKFGSADASSLASKSRPKVRMTQKDMASFDNSVTKSRAARRDPSASRDGNRSVPRDRASSIDVSETMDRNQYLAEMKKSGDNEGIMALTTSADNQSKRPPISNRNRTDKRKESNGTSMEKGYAVSIGKKGDGYVVSIDKKGDGYIPNNLTNEKKSQDTQYSSDGIEDLSGLSDAELSTESVEKKVDENKEEKVPEPEPEPYVYAATEEHGDFDVSSMGSDNENQELESLSEFWMEVEGQHDLVHEDQANVAQQAGNGDEHMEQNESAPKSRRKVKPLRFYDPPTELKKLLKIVHSPTTDEDVTSDNASLAGTARRVNACGALKALAKKEKNRLRLARTKGVVSGVCCILIDPISSTEERARCSATLLSLCVPSQNWEAITTIHEDIFDNFGNIIENNDDLVLYNICFSLFLLTNFEKNRNAVCLNEKLLQAMTRVLILPIPEDYKVTDENLENDENLGSVSGEQESPAFNHESQRGSRLSILKSLLKMAKVQNNAYVMARNKSLIPAMTGILGTMPPQENLLCMAILTNLTRHKENCEHLMKEYTRFIATVLKCAVSVDSECKKCAILALQNILCDKVCRQEFVKYPEGLIILANIASKEKKNPEIRMAALHSIKNLCNEPSYMHTLLESVLVMSVLRAITKDKSVKLQMIACDCLATLSQWLYTSAQTCISKHGIDIGNRQLGSMACTWDQWH